MSTAKRKKMGRPKIKLNYGVIEKLALIQCTQAEIASFLGVSTRTLERDENFCQIYKKGLEKGQMSLRRLQFRKAQEGNVPMLIWLGKQYLGQRDKAELSGDQTNPIGVTSVVISNLSKEEKEEFLRIYNKTIVQENKENSDNGGKKEPEKD